MRFHHVRITSTSALEEYNTACQTQLFADVKPASKCTCRVGPLQLVTREVALTAGLCLISRIWLDQRHYSGALSCLRCTDTCLLLHVRKLAGRAAGAVALGAAAARRFIHG